MRKLGRWVQVLLRSYLVCNCIEPMPVSYGVEILGSDAQQLKAHLLANQACAPELGKASCRVTQTPSALCCRRSCMTPGQTSPTPSAGCPSIPCLQRPLAASHSQRMEVCPAGFLHCPLISSALRAFYRCSLWLMLIRRSRKWVCKYVQQQCLSLRRADSGLYAHAGSSTACSTSLHTPIPIQYSHPIPVHTSYPLQAGEGTRTRNLLRSMQGYHQPCKGTIKHLGGQLCEQGRGQRRSTTVASWSDCWAAWRARLSWRQPQRHGCRHRRCACWPSSRTTTCC